MRLRLRTSRNKKKSFLRRTQRSTPIQPIRIQTATVEHPLLRMQRQYGNRYVQRVLDLAEDARSRTAGKAIQRQEEGREEGEEETTSSGPDPYKLFEKLAGKELTALLKNRERELPTLDGRTVRVPWDLAISPEAKIKGVYGTYPEYKVVIFEAGEGLRGLRTVAGAVGYGVAGGATTKFLERQGLWKALAWLAARIPAAAVAALTTLLFPNQVAATTWTMRVFPDGTRVTYHIIR